MVVREVEEESGLIVRASRVVGVYDANRLGEPIEFFHAFKIVFLCEHIGGTPRPGDETLDARFFSLDSLPELSSPRTDRRHLVEVFAHVDDPSRPTSFD
jgi:ADP-ribose pyrophosphatase YjhB (NUDIX family)